MPHSRRTESDVMEIISHPGPDRSVTIEDLKIFRVRSRRYRNRRIGDFLKELHLTEGRNTGFKKILDALKTNGSPLPEFETDEGHTYFISRFFIHEGFYEDNEGTDSSPKSSLKSSPLPGTEQRILDIIAENPNVSRQTMADQLNMSLAGIKKAIKRLSDKGLLHYEGSSRNGRWVIDQDR